MKTTKTVILALAIMLVFSACSGPTPTETKPVPTPTLAVQGTSAPYPAPGQTANQATQAYPAPSGQAAQSPELVFSLPTPGVDTGVVTGKVVDKDTKEPLTLQSIYLGTKILLTPGPDFTIGVQEKTSPHALTVGDGRFAIGGVKPGTYMVMVWTPFSAVVIMDPNTGKELEIKVEAGQTLDLGTLEGSNPMVKK